MIDPQDYAEIVAKRPELAVRERMRDPSSGVLMPIGGGWWGYVARMTGLSDYISRTFYESEAVRFIAWHWTEMLPPGYSLTHDASEWYIYDLESFKKWDEVNHPDPLSALTAFWRQYT